jgi:hypothetical protein
MNNTRNGAHTMPSPSRIYIGFVAAVGLVVLALGLYRSQWSGAGRFLAFLALALICSTQKIRLPRMKGTMSLSYLFILIGIADFSFAETLLLGCAAAVVQSLWRPKTTPMAKQVVFNIATLVICAGCADWASHKLLALTHTASVMLLLGSACFLFLITNTGLVAGVIALTEQRQFANEWLHCFYWSFPYFLVGTVAAGLVTATNHSSGWTSALLVLPLIYLCHFWYQIHVNNVAQRHAVVANEDELSAALVQR